MEKYGALIVLGLIILLILLIVTRKRRRLRRAARVANRSLKRYTPQPERYWVRDYYVDDFGDLTGKICIRGTFQGTFSNSSTSRSALTVYFYLDPKRPWAVFSRTLTELANNLF